jgi:lysophospholipase L1-like esterase
MAELHRDRERFLITGEGHPNADGYRRMAEALWQQLAPLL